MSLILILLGALPGAWPPAPDPRLQRALAYLVREVPSWPEENHCFSCHNNGDAARALFAARRLGHEVPVGALASTLRWLSDPEKWDSLPGDPLFSDKRLARIQFASALADALDARVLVDRGVLIQAAESLLPFQHPDGYWPLAGGRVLGNPVTYGIPLATHFARRTLLHAGPDRFREPAARAARWLATVSLANVPDAAAVILAALPYDSEPAVQYLLRAQASTGGWGPYPKSPPEPFDTAVALLALNSVLRPDLAPAMRRGRAWLAQTQLAEGCWPETTRPSGAQSYAQRVSTAGWATLALLHTISLER